MIFISMYLMFKFKKFLFLKTIMVRIVCKKDRQKGKLYKKNNSKVFKTRLRCHRAKKPVSIVSPSNLFSNQENVPLDWLDQSRLVLSFQQYTSLALVGFLPEDKKLCSYRKNIQHSNNSVCVDWTSYRSKVNLWEKTF